MFQDASSGQSIVGDDESALFRLAEMTEPYHGHHSHSDPSRGFDPGVAGQDEVVLVDEARGDKADLVDVPGDVGYLLLAVLSGI